jgi:glycine cleavage system H protein
LTEFGQRDLGEVLFVHPPKPGDSIVKGSPIGWLDTYRKHFDIITPVSGTIVSANASIAARPSDVNKFPYLRDGLVQIESSIPGELDELMPFPAYMDFTRNLERYETWSQELRLT